MPPTRSPSRSATPGTRSWPAAIEAAGRRPVPVGMIASVRGEVLVRRPDHVVIECRGRRLPAHRLGRDARSVPASGKEATLHSHLVVRDDALALYGFATEEERDLFLHLISVSGDRPEGRDRDPLRRHLRASCAARSPRATRSGSRPCPGSASEPPSG